MVFQLAEVLNLMNGNNTDLAVNFIPWIQSSPKYAFLLQFSYNHTD